MGYVRTMKTTIEADRRTKLVSWLIGGMIFLSGLLLLLLLPHPENGQTKRTISRQHGEDDEQKRKRPMLKDDADQLVRQAETLIKKQLRERLAQFEKMADVVQEKEDALLSRVESREILPGLPDDLNDTSIARNTSLADRSPLGNEASVEEIYERLEQLEREIQQNYVDTEAAQYALKNATSYPEAHEYVGRQQVTSQMADFDELVEQQSEGEAWSRSSDSIASSGLDIRTTDDLNRYRGVLRAATGQAGLAKTRLESMLGMAKKNPGPPPSSNSSQGGDGKPGTGFADALSAKAGPGFYEKYEVKLDGEMVKAQALPGRRFTRDAQRKGWLYINSWYMIGPWENFGQDFTPIHPPELAVDFDAVYHDGLTGKGIEETESDPIRVEGKTVVLDGTLRWKYMQSESMHNTVPVLADRSTYYAYTEIYFDEPTTMLVAIGTDDSGKIWINGSEVWHDEHSSWYHVDEHIEPFDFKYGWNTILVRLENGGGSAAGFSILICPKESVDAAVAAL